MRYEEAIKSGKPFNRRKYRDGWYVVDDRGLIIHTKDLSIRNPTFTEEDKNADDWVIMGDPYNGKRVFVVRMLRYGSDENHSYLWGVWSTYEKALHEAKIGMTMRVGKYDAEIWEEFIDSHESRMYRRISWGDFDPREFET